MKNTKSAYSVVVPVYNEAANIKQLDKEIKAVMSRISRNYEIIYVNDGSDDGSLKELKKLHNATIIDLNRNYGQSTALDAGLRAANGEIVISLDADLQNDARDIPNLLKKLKEDNLDVVTGWRKYRKDRYSVRILTRISRFLRSIIIKDNVHDSGCTLRVYIKEAAKSLDLSGEMHRYILALFRWKGFRVGEVVVNHRARIHGKSKYGLSKALKGFIDLIYMWFINKYAHRPLHMFGAIGLLSFLLGFLSGFMALYQKIFNNVNFNRSGWFLSGIFFLLAGIIFFSFGITLDLLIKTYLNTSPYEKRYYIRNIIKT